MDLYKYLYHPFIYILDTHIDMDIQMYIKVIKLHVEILEKHWS